MWRLHKEADRESRKVFEKIRESHPELRYEDVFIVAPNAVKMKDGKIFRVPEA